MQLRSHQGRSYAWARVWRDVKLTTDGRSRVWGITYGACRLVVRDGGSSTLASLQLRPMDQPRSERALLLRDACGKPSLLYSA